MIKELKEKDLCGLVKENKYVKAVITFDNQPSVEGYFTERIYMQANNKLRYMLSKRLSYWRNEEQIYFEEGDMDDEKHIYATMMLMPNIYLYAPNYKFYHKLAGLMNFIENRFPSKMTMLLFFLFLWLLFK